MKHIVFQVTVFFLAATVNWITVWQQKIEDATICSSFEETFKGGRSKRMQVMMK